MLPGWPGLAMEAAAAAAAVVAAVAGLKAWRRYRASERSRARRHQLRELIRDEPGGVLVCRGERIVAANEAARMLLPAQGALEGSLLAGVIPGWTVDRIPQAGDAEALVSGAGRTCRLRLARRTAHVGDARYTMVSVRSRERHDGGGLWDALAERFASPEPGAFGLVLLELHRNGPSLASEPLEDELMRRVAARLGAGPAGVWLATRFGRDRFVLLVDGASRARLHALADSLRAVLIEWLRTEADAPDVRARTGTALAPADAASPRALVDAAERALCGEEVCRAG